MEPRLNFLDAAGNPILAEGLKPSGHSLATFHMSVVKELSGEGSVELYYDVPPEIPVDAKPAVELYERSRLHDPQTDVDQVYVICTPEAEFIRAWPISDAIECESDEVLQARLISTDQPMEIGLTRDGNIRIVGYLASRRGNKGTISRQHVWSGTIDNAGSRLPREAMPPIFAAKSKLAAGVGGTERAFYIPPLVLSVGM